MWNVTQRKFLYFFEKRMGILLPGKRPRCVSMWKRNKKPCLSKTLYVGGGRTLTARGRQSANFITWKWFILVHWPPRGAASRERRREYPLSVLLKGSMCVPLDIVWLLLQKKPYTILDMVRKIIYNKNNPEIQGSGYGMAMVIPHEYILRGVMWWKKS